MQIFSNVEFCRLFPHLNHLVGSNLIRTCNELHCIIHDHISNIYHSIEYLAELFFTMLISH